MKVMFVKAAVLLLLLHFCNGARILGVFHVAAPSHYNLASSLMKGLADAGHDVTIISPFTEKFSPTNGTYREIVLTGALETHKANIAKWDAFSTANSSPFLSIVFFSIMGVDMTEATLQHKMVQKLLKSDEKFDVVIVGEFMNDAMKAFASHFGAHLIIFSSIGSNEWVNSLVGNPSLPSYAPEIVMNFPEKMNFFQRLQNTLFCLFQNVVKNVFTLARHQALVEKYFPKPVDLNDARNNVSLVLLNSHISLSNPESSVPNMVNIGGFHIKPPKKLPADLQEFMDNAKEGVVYFSMGSNLQSKDLPIEKREAILKAFSKLKMKVLWKWETDVLPNQPANVKLSKWLPQQDILAHPNMKVFITHGGLLSTTETVYHGVPIIAIPIFGDQKINALNAQMNGYGLVLPFAEVSEEKLTNFLKEILGNPKYAENARLRSQLMKDRQVKPIDAAVYWVEYVIRYNGAKHLRMVTIDMPWYKYYLLDVFAFISIVLVGALLLLKKMCSLCCKRKPNVTVNKVKKS